MSRIKIVKVTEEDIDFIEIITDWLYNWWGKIEGYSKQAIKEYSKRAVCEKKIPCNGHIPTPEEFIVFITTS